MIHQLFDGVGDGILFVISGYDRSGHKLHLPIGMKPIGELKTAETLLKMGESVTHFLFQVSFFDLRFLTRIIFCIVIPIFLWECHI